MSPPPSSSDAEPAPEPRLIDRAAALWPRYDDTIYAFFAGGCVLYAATTFYASLHAQTHGAWSAPLDDVFIHFDYARATARGYPFQWSEGNGFSSGNTSLSYPFALALGYWIGFRGMSIMVWAALVACISTLGFFMASAKLTEPLGRWAKYLIPPLVLSVGALDWSLWSGMENAFYLGIWGLALHATLGVVRAAEDEARPPLRWRGWLAGAAGALLFATRPESVVCIVVFAVLAAIAVRRSHGNGAALATLLRVGIPGAMVLVAQALANRLFTGEWSANGAIAKLGLNDPYMPPREKVDEYFFLLKYVILRNARHHFAEAAPGTLGWGWIVPAVGLLPLFDKRTRKPAILLWTSAIGWLLLVALNRQVRWQNERYTMSAVAWVLVLFAMGLGVILSRARISERLERFERGVFGLRVGVVAAIVAAFWWHQLPQMRDQIWFFGRASRNIRDQHVMVGKVLAEVHARRVLVGDAGALMYSSDLPGLDIIGLGGYHDLPFARAGVNGLGASLELIERMPTSERPDMMAIYPSWWGDLPTLFGRRIGAIPAYGNVICGDFEKVIYKADWSALDRSGKPRVIQPGEHIADELDVADLVSEKAHGYTFPHPAMGFVDFRVLGDVIDRRRDLFDAGRVIPPGQSETVHVRAPRGGGRLVARTVVGHDASIEVRAGGRVLGTLKLKPSKGWIEPSIDLPADLPAQVELTLTPSGGDWLDCHLWILENAPPGSTSP